MNNLKNYVLELIVTMLFMGCAVYGALMLGTFTAYQIAVGCIVIPFIAHTLRRTFFM